MAQLVERSTEKPGAILIRVRVPDAARDFSGSQLSAQTLSRCPYSLLCAIARVNISAHVKNPRHWQPYQCLDTRRQAYCTRRNKQQMGSATPAAAVPYPGKATQISRKGQRNTLKKV